MSPWTNHHNLFDNKTYEHEQIVFFHSNGVVQLEWFVFKCEGLESDFNLLEFIREAFQREISFL